MFKGVLIGFKPAGFGQDLWKKLLVQLWTFRRSNEKKKMTDYVQVCDSANIDANGACTVTPTWEPLPSWFPSLDAASGVTISVAILACWATAFGFRAIQRAGD